MVAFTVCWSNGVTDGTEASPGVVIEETEARVDGEVVIARVKEVDAPF